MINLANKRFVELARKMFRGFPKLRAWEQTDDVSQNAAVRLRLALEAVMPETVREFFCLAAEQIRRVLIDMTRSHFGRRRRVSGGDSQGENGASAKGEAAPRRPIVHVGVPQRKGASDASTAQAPRG